MEPVEGEFQKLAAAGRFLDAVRLYRREHGGSLEEAWDAVERIASEAAANLRGLPVHDPAVAAEIDALVRTGQKILAIKALRGATGLGLKEAKDVIDRHGVGLGPVPRDPKVESLQRAITEGEGTSSRYRAQRPASRTGCFIATAAYGDPSAPEVVALRRFRDRVLRRTRPGRIMVRIYYRLSPPVAAALDRSEVARALIRRLLTPAAACCAARLRSRGSRVASREVSSNGTQ